jgi:hypothetical protein
MRYNLARAWMDGGFYAQGGEILAELFAAAPEEYRFATNLALRRNLWWTKTACPTTRPNASPWSPACRVPAPR